jgi:hypothetical protein
LLAIIDGRPVGLDLVSLTSAYAKLHTKLVRSYTLEGLLDAPPSTINPQPSTTSPSAVAPGSALRTSNSELARAFLADIAAAEERKFPSVGHGTDHRYKGKALAGSVLVHENEAIHAAFFRLDETEQPERMASYRARRRHGYE